MTEKAVRYLTRDAESHIDMLEPLRRGTARVVEADDSRGALLYLPAANLYLASTSTPDDGKWLVNRMENALLAAAHQDYLADGIAERFGLEKTMCCKQAVWNDSAPPAVPSSPLALEIRPLTLDRAAEVETLYSHEIGIDYIRGRILAGEMFGAFSEGELTGFIGLHEEGSMGMLEVVPSYRRRGIGAYLISHLCGALIKKGWPPFSQFTVENTASEKLHRSMGFQIPEGEVYWLEQR